MPHEVERLQDRLIQILQPEPGANALKHPAVKHVVAFKFKGGADPEKIHQVEVAFAALKSSIPQIQSLEWGTNVSPEPTP